MSTLKVNTIEPYSGTTVAVTGTLEVSGTIKSYALETITTSETTYLGSNKFGNDSADAHQFTGSIHVTGSGITLTAAAASTATFTLVADQGDDGVDTATLSVADGGAVTLSGSTNIILDADGGSVLMKDKGTALFTFAANEIDVASGNLTLDVAGDIILDAAGGDVLPASDNATNLGSSSKRWANVYTGDLHLKNERGDWTILEEEDYLCVINNTTGKKFKMMLQEIED